MPKRASTLARHKAIRMRVYNHAQKLWNVGVRDFVRQACHELSDETGYAPSTLEDIYYGRH